MNARFFVITGLAVVLLLTLIVAFAVVAPCFPWLFGYRVRMHITNRTDSELVLTSTDTMEATRIPKDASATLSHLMGDVFVRSMNGNTWVYRNISPDEFRGSVYMVARRYPVPMGGGTLTVKFLIDNNRNLDLVRPEKDVDTTYDVERELKRYPIEPANCESTTIEQYLVEHRSKQDQLVKEISDLGATVYVHSDCVSLSFSSAKPYLPSGDMTRVVLSDAPPPESLSDQDVDVIREIDELYSVELGSVSLSDENLRRLREECSCSLRREGKELKK